MVKTERLLSALAVGVLATAPPTSSLAEKDPRTPAEILARIDTLIGAQAQSWCKEQGLDYPPPLVLFRAFKKEGELEVWAGQGKDRLRLVQTLPICAVDQQPGPKLKRYDHKTPEGFYLANFLYNSRNPWMWIKLDPDLLPEYGIVGDGASFYLHINYPNPVDRAHSQAAHFATPGSAICLHGNCVTEGCVSFTNQAFLYVYAFAAHHNQKAFGKVEVHLFPFRFDRAQHLDAEAAGYVHGAKLGSERLRRFWENLEQGFVRFNRDPKPLRYSYGPTVLTTGDVSPDVLRVKRLLESRGLFQFPTGQPRGELDPVFGDDLTTAVRAFQRQRKLRPSGKVDTRTQAALGLDWPTRYHFED